MRKEFVLTSTLEQAKERAPWAKAFENVGGGFYAYEDAEELSGKLFKEEQELINAYGVLRKYGQAQLEFHVHDGDIKHLITLIRSLENWNDFKATTVADTVSLIFQGLPKAYYGEDNPNNGCPEFDRLEIIGDTSIIFKAYRLKKFDEIVQSSIKEMAETCGKRMKADEREFWEESTDTDGHNQGYQYYIRFWWD